MTINGYLPVADCANANIRTKNAKLLVTLIYYKNLLIFTAWLFVAIFNKFVLRQKYNFTRLPCWFLSSLYHQDQKAWIVSRDKFINTITTVAAVIGKIIIGSVTELQKSLGGFV